MVWVSDKGMAWVSIFCETWRAGVLDSSLPVAMGPVNSFDLSAKFAFILISWPSSRIVGWV